MTRRTLLLAVPSALKGTTQKEMADAGNAFHAVWKAWADDINSTPLGQISATAILMASKMDKLYKDFRTKRKRWEEGE
jgi:hypothetical protein